MADAVAVWILLIILAACGFGQVGCNFKGPGIAYKVDGVAHHFKLGDK